MNAPTPPNKYRFAWRMLGDLKTGRPTLGTHTRVENYRLMQFCLRDVMEKELGGEQTDRFFYKAGYLAGLHFYNQFIGPGKDLKVFVEKLKKALREMEIGLLDIENADAERGEFTLTVTEDIDCSGLPDIAAETCHYDEGFIAALMESFYGRPFKVKEIDCWSSGCRTCRFKASLIGSE